MYKESPVNKKTRWTTVQGLRMVGSKMYRTRIVVRVTHDSKGKSLSLEDGDRMFLIPLEGLEELIDTTF